MRTTKGLKQAYDVQDFAHECIMRVKRQVEQDEQLTKDSIASIAALTRAWCDAQERIRIHRGKPLPGSKRPAAAAPRTSGNGAGGLT